MRQSVKVFNRYRKGVVGAKVWVPGLAWLEFGFRNKLWGTKEDQPMQMKRNPVFRQSIDSSLRAQQTAIVRVLAKEIRKLENAAK